MINIIAQFKEGQVLELTPEMELQILRYIKDNGEYLGAGTSRAVYEFMNSYVVKVGLSVEGQLQNKVERDFYHDHWETNLFATLYATGKFINIAEKLTRVEQCDDEDVFCDTVSELNYVTDYDGGDNEQIGYSAARGVWVAYDYGYSTEYSHCDLVGCMDEWVYELDVIDLAIQGIEEDRTYTSEQLWEIVRNHEEDKFNE